MKQIFHSINARLGPVTPGLKPIILAVLITALLTSATLAVLGVNRSFMITLSGFFILAILLAIFGYTALGSWSALAAALIVLSVLMYKNYGIRDVAMIGLVAVLIAAGLLAGKFGTIVIGCLIIVEVGIYGALEMSGAVTNPFSVENNFSDYFAASLGIALVTVLQWLVIARLNDTVETARNELEERKKYQGQLQEAEARYRSLVEKIPLVIYMSEPGENGRWHFISPQIEAMTGFPPSEWLDDPVFWYSRVHPDDRDRVMMDEADALSGGRMPKLEYRLLTRDGRYIWISDESMVLLDADLLLVQGFMLDITDRKQAEDQLTKRLAELQAMHGISEALIQKNDLKKLIHDTGEQIRLAFKANNVLIAVHDPATDLIHFPYDYEDGVPRKDIPIRYGEGMTSKVMDMKAPIFIDTNWLKRSNELNAIHTNTIPILSSFSAPIMTNDRVIGVVTLESTEQEYAFSEIDTRPILTIAANLAVAIEKTRLQEAVKKEMEIQERLIRELEIKNEELERFTYTASHDLKSPLITIRGFLGYLEQDAKRGNYDRLNIDIQRISDATEKMHKLLSELLELSRIGRVANEKQDTPFDEIVKEALSRVEGQLMQKKVAVRVGGGFPTVHADRERIIEVVQNLVDNAIKFTEGVTDPLVEIDHIQHDGHAILYVRDNGIGIKKEFHKRIFGLFDKLNPDTEGTGVGLALVKRIVEVHGGSVWVDSTEGAGATFYFTLK